VKNHFLLIGLCLLFAGWGSCPIANAEDSATVLDVYYLYGSPRCSTCQKIESDAKKTVETNFSEELVSGEIVFRAVNTDLPENKHYLKDYGLYTKSVVLSLRKDGREIRFKNLEKIWSLLRNETAFADYIRDEIHAMKASAA